MRISARYALYIGVVALFAGCGANQTTLSSGSYSLTPMSVYQHHTIQDLNRMVAMANALHKGIPARQHPLTHSWTHKPPKGTKGTLWATDDEYASVDMIAYPSGTLIGQVAGFSLPYSDCSDKNGNVYVTDLFLDEGFEIAAGTTSIINSWPTGGEAIGCSVSNGGDVSFTNFSPGGVMVFPGGGQSGTNYPGPGFDWPAGYDPHGNLYVECSDESPCSSPQLYELPAGGSSWTHVNLDTTISFPGPVQNMGKYLGVADQKVRTTAGIYLVEVSGSDATVAKTIVLTGQRCSYVDFSTSWASINKKPNGVTTKDVKDVAIVNLDCFPNPIDLYEAKNGEWLRSIGQQYGYAGVTFTKP